MADSAETQDLPISDAVGAENIASDQRALLDLIDAIQFADLPKIKLPQIVVVGDQSAGKSSVLEAITAIPFPHDATFCTRFPTEIRLRRAKKDKFSVRIIPGASSKAILDRQHRLDAFGDSLDSKTSFGELMARAIELITPRGKTERIADDTLIIEKEGPEQPLLTLVDLPGLVSNASSDHSAEDVEAIHKLTDRYIKSSRAIILAVIGGNYDYALAPVLTRARTVDPNGFRTIGVLTKPDLADGLEEKFVALLNNKDKQNRFTLGWHVLQTGPHKIDQVQVSMEERKRRENQTLNTGKWSALPRDICGAGALEQKLSTQLLRHISGYVPILQREIDEAYAKCLADLRLLGHGHEDVEDMRKEIQRLCMNSRDLVIQAVDGTWKNPPGMQFFKTDPNPAGTPAENLRARVVEENKTFAQRMKQEGRKIHFVPEVPSKDSKDDGQNTTKKEEFAREVVEPLIRQFTGTEFPLDHNPTLVYNLFRGYSSSWIRLAQEHKDSLRRICNEFLSEVIEEIWPLRMREPLRKELLDPQTDKLSENAQSALEILAKVLYFEIQPYDPVYQDRMMTWLSKPPQNRKYSDAEILLEKMLIYYELSEKTFTHNVIAQVIEHHLLQGLRDIFSWSQIDRLDDNTIKKIAAETEETTKLRKDLNKKKDDIGKARDACANLAKRKDMRTFGERHECDSDSDDETRETLKGVPVELMSK